MTIIGTGTTLGGRSSTAATRTSPFLEIEVAWPEAA